MLQFREDGEFPSKFPLPEGMSQGEGREETSCSLHSAALLCGFINEVPSGVWLVAQYPNHTTRWHDCSSHASKGRPGVRITGKLIPTLGWKESLEITWSISMFSEKWRFYSFSKTHNY